jgi:P27 family predicted phage terminase small subunit
MGKRGPKPTPTKVLAARGSWRARTRPAEPDAPSAKPVCPKGRSATWRACWRWLTTQLEAMSLLSTAEEQDIRRYCDAHEHYTRANTHIEKNGLMLEMRNAENQIVQVVKNPMMIERARLSAELLRLGQQFGLTPSARAGLGAMVKPPEGPKQEGKGGTLHFFDQRRA